MTEIKKDTFELDEDELDSVTGGTNNVMNTCNNFYPQYMRPFTRNCRDCFFYHGGNRCSYPKENSDEKKETAADKPSFM